HDFVERRPVPFLRSLDQVEVNQHAVKLWPALKSVASKGKAHRQIARLQGFARKGKNGPNSHPGLGVYTLAVSPVKLRTNVGKAASPSDMIMLNLGANT